MFKLSFHRVLAPAASCVCAAVLLSACGGGSSGTTAAGNTSTTSTQSLASSSVGENPGTDTIIASSASATSTRPASTTPASSTTTSTDSTSTSSAPAATTGAGPYGQDASQYTLTFSDEFDNGFNSNVWNDAVWYEQSNATKNYTVENGMLKIWPQRDGANNFFNRTIDTDGKYYQTYGYFEIEAKLPYGKGTWPAFWLFNHDQPDPIRPEIDILEAYAGGGANSGWSDANLHPTAYAATIWPTGANGGTAGTKTIQNLGDLSAGFHKYAVKWEPNKQTFYFDGKEVYSVNVSMGSRMYILLDLWFGSASGTPDNSTPQGKNNSYEVNYVRAWKFK